MKFSGKLKKARKEKKINQDELARMIGVSKRTIQNYENSGMYPKKRDTYYKLAEILDVDINYLLTENKESNLYDVESICKLIEGGSLSESDLDVLMNAISEAYSILKKEKFDNCVK